MACGAVVTASAPGFAVFLVGRVITGIGAACIFPVSILFVLELTSKKRRGLFIGLVNSGFTSGVALGAVVAGALAPALGWVLYASILLLSRNTDYLTEGCVLAADSVGTIRGGIRIPDHSKISGQEWKGR